MRPIAAQFILFKRKSILVWAALVLCWLVLTWMIFSYFPFGADWRDTYHPAIWKILTGHSPYEIPFFRNAPWLLLPLIPFALMPMQLGYAAWDALSLMIFGLMAKRLGAKPLTILFLIFSYPVIFGLYYGQIDALVILGYVLPPPIGIFFVLAKPQIGIGVAIYWAVEAWRTGGLRNLLQLLVPVSLAFLASFAIYGPWFLQSLKVIRVSAGANTSIWPFSIPIGLVLLVVCARKRIFGLSITSSTFLTPYLAAHSWAAALLGLLPYQAEMIAASIGIWIAAGLKGWWL